MAEDFIGARVRSWRLKRGISQTALAGLIGLSQGYVSQIESGLKAIDKRSTLVRLAEALQVSVADLTGQPYPPSDPPHTSALTAIPQIRAALIGLAFMDLPAAPQRSAEQFASDVRQLMHWRRDCEYARAAHLLAPLLCDLGAAAYGPRATDRTGALRQLALTAYTAAFVLRYLGFVDLSLSAAQRCHLSAHELGEPAWIGLAEFTRLHTLPPEGLGIGRTLAATTADALQQHLADVEARQVYGMLQLTSAWTEALAGKEDTMLDHLREADEIAESLGPEPADGGFAQMNFGPTNINQWRSSLALEAGQPGRAVELARAVDPGKILSTSRRAQFHIDLGCALTASRRHDAQALAQFVCAERIAPQRVRLAPAVRDAVGAMLRRARADAGGVRLRDLAGRVGLS